MKRVKELKETREVLIGEAEVVTCNQCRVEAPPWMPEATRGPHDLRRANITGWFLVAEMAGPFEAVAEDKVQHYCPKCAATHPPVRAVLVAPEGVR